MQKTVFEFPDRLHEFVVDDTLFARAYDAIPDYRRALLKTCIARSYEWYGPSQCDSGRTAQMWRSGLSSVEQVATLDFAVVVFDGTLVSPTRLLAAVVPALASGVRNVLVVRLGGGEWHQPLLTGLELAGQELVADMTTEELQLFLDECNAAEARGLVLGVGMERGNFKALRFPSNRVAFKCLNCDQAVSVWSDSEQLFDLQALAFAQPDLNFSVFGAEGEGLPDSFSFHGNDFSDFLESLREVAYAPASCVDEALNRARIVLGPGQEGCWVWPQLRPEDFQFHSTAWTIGA